MTKPKRVMYCEVSKMRFLKYVDQLEAYVDKLELDNKPPAFNVVNSEMTEESIRDFIELIEPEKQWCRPQLKK